jgi:hypothetical protein
MVILSFRTKKDKEKLYEKARKMEEYASMIVECLEDAGYDGDYEEDAYRDSYRRMYRDHSEEEMKHMPESRYGYRGMR